MPAFTTDGDLVIEPARLKDEARLVEAMQRAQFARGRQPGSWVATREVDSVLTTIPVDLLVPEAVAGVVVRRDQEITAIELAVARDVRGSWD